MEIINNFGLDPLLLGAQIVNFLIIFYVLKRFLYKPVLGILKKREDTIKEGLRQAEDGKKLFEEAQNKEKEILTRAQNQAQTILEEAKIQTDELAKQIEQKAQKNASDIINSATEKINQEREIAEKKLSEYVSRLAVELLEKSASELFDAKDQKQLIKIATDKFKKLN
ncbi:MAG: F0F1 ATP synthase subunit B [Candidatus Levybacteria bacterium]|nr:F0F1 ATP synthase subunit B [Candidatus Levybacteria bacterium]